MPHFAHSAVFLRNGFPCEPFSVQASPHPVNSPCMLCRSIIMQLTTNVVTDREHRYGTLTHTAHPPEVMSLSQ